MPNPCNIFPPGMLFIWRSLFASSKNDSSDFPISFVTTNAPRLTNHKGHKGTKNTKEKMYKFPFVPLCLSVLSGFRVTTLVTLIHQKVVLYDVILHILKTTIRICIHWRVARERYAGGGSHLSRRQRRCGTNNLLALHADRRQRSDLCE